MNIKDKRQLIAARLREARKLSGLSQGQVAKIMELHRPSISEIEAGNRGVSAEELSQLAEIYDVSVGYLLGELPDTMDRDDPRLQLAARELGKLTPEALNSLLRALAAFRTDEPDEGR